MEKVQVNNRAGVYILDVPSGIDRMFDYFVPEELREELREGMFVCVPFGRGNRAMTAVVFELSYKEDVSELKPVAQILEAGGLYLNEEMRALALFISDQTFSTVGDAVRTIVPTGCLKGLSACYRAVENTEERRTKLNETARMVYAVIADATDPEDPTVGVTGEQLGNRFGEDVTDLLAALVKLGVVDRFYKENQRAGRVYERIYSPSPKEHCRPKGTKQEKIYDEISLRGSASLGELTERFGNCAPQLKAMVDKGQLVVRKEEHYRRVYTGKSPAPDENLLTEEQERAKEQICSLLDTGLPKAALLYGVTGSGKTRVMKAVIDHVLHSGRSVIVLVPEISLTPQTVGLFSSFFGDQVAILHSGLSLGQRYDEWRRIREGRASVCIGTRSAVFAPFENLGLIIMDEEQEHTYKSDMTPRYHARDIARFRCGKQNAVMLLSSATPSVESFYKAEQGIYTLCTLEKRYGSAPLPKAIICDMRGEAGVGSPIGDVLAGELEANFKRGEQSVLFVGRRGYNSFASCALCGEVLLCPHCSVSLTYHTFRRYRPEENSATERAKNGYMLCHYCGYRQNVPPDCPSCGSKLLQFMGCGTQMVENEMEKLFDRQPVLRLDADTTGSKDAFDSKLELFRKGEYSVMLGTQMVTKGHDFPGVTLVGVISADRGLYTDDYRAAENTFSLITQVIGRAGRGKLPGRAVIQTYNPDHRVLALAAAQNYREFYENEIRLRRSLVFPPFCDLLLLSLSSEEESELRQAVLETDKELRRLIDEEHGRLPVTVFGPFEAPLYRVKDQYRMRYVLKTRNSKTLRAMLHRLNRWFSGRFRQKVLLSIDMNPSSL